MRKLWLKLKRRKRMQQDLETELEFHREMAARAGNPLRVGPIREEAYDAWRFVFLENLWRDIVYAARGLRKSPALAAAALLSLALGIGANTTIFSLGMEFLFSEPSVKDPASIVSVRLGGNSHSPQQVLDFLSDSGLFQSVAGENEEAYINWNDGAGTRPIFGVFTSANYFQALGVPVEYGRGFLPDDPKEVVVLEHRFWTKYFNSDLSVIGRTINLDGRACTVVGILPEIHRTLMGFGLTPDLYTPQYLDSTALAIYARLKPGMTIGQARSGLKTVAVHLDSTLPAAYKYAQGIRVSPIAGYTRFAQEQEFLGIGVFFMLLLGVTGLVLMIACINVASLLMGRAAVRRHEIATRLALGASRSRLLQQLLCESLLLAIAGAGLGLGMWRVLATLVAQVQLPLPLPIRLRITPDWRLALYAAFLTVLATIACGLLPAWQSVKGSLVADIQRARRLRLRRTLVIAQLAISLVVLFTGFLFLRNLFAANAISPGFDVRNTLRADVHLPPAEYKDAPQINRYVAQALGGLRAIPGVSAAAAARIVPFTDNTQYASELVFPDGGEKVHATFRWNAVSPAFFKVMDIPVTQGREFLETDGQGQRVVIVNRTFVKQYLGNRPALGQTFLWGAKNVYEIVGVVETTKTLTIGEDPQPQLYEPLAQIVNDRPRIQFVISSAIPPAMQLQPVREALRRLDPAAGIEAATLYSSIGLAFLPSQVGAILMGSTGALGLILAAIGLYGVMVFSVAQRTREIGVRVAIGASPHDVRHMVLVDSAKLIATGSAIGMFVAVFVTKPLAMFLVPDLKTADPLSFSIVLAVLGLTGFLATWGPVRRALAVDPIVSLRQD